MKVIFFDAAGTLFHVRGTVGEIYVQHARKYGVTADPELVHQAFTRAFADAPPLAFAVSDANEIRSCERLWWFDVVHHVFYRLGMFEGFDDYFDEVFNYFATPEAWQLYPETVATLQALEARGVELGIISDFDSRLYQLLLGLGIDRFFESVTLSSFAGAAKPSPHIFQRALIKHAATPAQTLHVGDSLREDVQGATAAGLKAVLLDRGGHAEPPPNVVAIKTLHELLSVMDRP